MTESGSGSDRQCSGEPATAASDDGLAAALSHHQAGRLDEAESLYRAVLDHRPDDATSAYLLGLVHRARGDFELAIDAIGKAVAIVPDHAAAHAALADALSRVGRFTQAIDHYRRALALDASVATVWHGLARALAIIGEVREAADCLRKATELDPDLVAAHYDWSASGTADSIGPLQRLLQRDDLSVHERIITGVALGQALDRAARYDGAFAVVSEAKRAARREQIAAGQGFDANELRAYVDQRISACTKAFFATTPGLRSHSELPVFIVGMPRSGTTLVERILASHSHVVGIGEGHYIGRLADELGAHVRSASYGDWDPAWFMTLADRYLSRLRAMSDGSARVVDKTPDNIFHLGLLARLFKNALVIVCQRDPRDVCLSCYFQAFEYSMPYANDLLDCATRIQETDRLLAHWRAVLPLRLLEVRYEDLVANPEVAAKRLIAFLGLDWEPACLDFHSQPGVVTSASVWQVRRPIYTSSVGHWRHYRNQIAPLLAVFGSD